MSFTSSSFLDRSLSLSLSLSLSFCSTTYLFLSLSSRAADSSSINTPLACTQLSIRRSQLLAIPIIIRATAYRFHGNYTLPRKINDTHRGRVNGTRDRLCGCVLPQLLPGHFLPSFFITILRDYDSLLNVI